MRVGHVLVKLNRFLFSMYDTDIVLSSSINRVRLPLYADESTDGFRLFPNFIGVTPGLFKLSSHNSVLLPTVVPHPPHKHSDEEVLILLSGNLDVILPDTSSTGDTVRLQMKPMDILFYPAYQLHTIESTGVESAQYCIFRWETQGPFLARRISGIQMFSFSDQYATYCRGVMGFVHKKIFDIPTVYLDRLHCHISALEPGAGYEPHTDVYDVAIVVLKGHLETIGKKASPYDVVYYAAGEPHGMKNIGKETAIYLVFEFHTNPLRTLIAAPWKLASKIIRKTISVS